MIVFVFIFYICRRQERIRQGKPPLEEAGPDVSDDDDDAEWYKKEVGVAPDPGMSMVTIVILGMCNLYSNQYCYKHLKK